MTTLLIAAAVGFVVATAGLQVVARFVSVPPAPSPPVPDVAFTNPDPFEPNPVLAAGGVLLVANLMRDRRQRVVLVGTFVLIAGLAAPLWFIAGWDAVLSGVGGFGAAPFLIGFWRLSTIAQAMSEADLDAKLAADDRRQRGVRRRRGSDRP